MTVTNADIARITAAVPLHRGEDGRLLGDVDQVYTCMIGAPGEVAYAVYKAALAVQNNSGIAEAQAELRRTIENSGMDTNTLVQRIEAGASHNDWSRVVPDNTRVSRYRHPSDGGTPTLDNTSTVVAPRTLSSSEDPAAAEEPNVLQSMMGGWADFFKGLAAAFRFIFQGFAGLAFGGGSSRSTPAPAEVRASFGNAAGLNIVDADGSAITVNSNIDPSRTLNGTTRPHEGIDIQAESGDAIPAIGGGYVVDVHDYGRSGWGKTALVLTAVVDDYEVYYREAHMSQVNAREGAWVDAGETIGLVGETGEATGPHRHLEVMIVNRETGVVTKVDPRSLVEGPINRAAIDRALSTGTRIQDNEDFAFVRRVPQSIRDQIANRDTVVARADEPAAEEHAALDPDVDAFYGGSRTQTVSFDPGQFQSPASETDRNVRATKDYADTRTPRIQTADVRLKGPNPSSAPELVYT